MAIPDYELNRLKQGIPLVRLAEERGIKLKRHGADLLGLCPFHDDKEPSLVISPAKNLWHCLGACQTGGSVIDWIMKADGVGFTEAVERLQRQAPALAASAVPSPKPKAAPPSEELQPLLNRVTAYYHAVLKQHPQALAYLERRGLHHPDLIDTFKLGVADRTLTGKLAESGTAEGKATRERLQRLGVLRASGHEHLNGCLVVPVLDEAGNATELYGRRLNVKAANAPKHLYLPGPHQGVFNIAAFQATDKLILCESLIDALTFWSAGYRNVTTSYGTGGFTDELFSAIRAHGIKVVYIAYDRDAAGDNAALAVAEKLGREGIGCYRVLFPKGMDANEYALKVQPAEKSLGLVLDRAEWLGSGPEPVKPVVTVTQGEEGEEKAAKEAKDKGLTEPGDTLPPLAANPPIKTKAHEVLITLGNRHYRIRGLDKNLSYDRMKVNLRVSIGEVIHVDTFDLYAAKPRALFTQQAARELGLEEVVIKRDLGKVLLQLEALQEQQIKQTLEPQKAEVALSEAEHDAALALLKTPDLLARIVADFGRCGLVGEETNTLVGYLAAVSRKLDNPLALLIQSTSAAGKSSLMDAVLALMPEEDRVQYSAMTGQSLYYMSGKDLKHKILAVAEEEGASQASYALKLLQSEGELTIASTGKNPESGNLETQEYHVEGPVMLALTTTAIDLDEELLNRCLVLTVNEDREQTKAIHQRQRERRTLEGLLAKQEKQAVLTQHRNAQRLLRPLAVVNPYARELTFLDDKTRTRRDHEKYLTLIESIALLHQHQRPIKSIAHGEGLVEYIEVTLEDIEIANRLAHEVLGRTLDELPPQTRRLLSLLDAWVTATCEAQKITREDHRFSRREVREESGWGDTQLKVHLGRLVELEYLAVHRQGQRYHYELLYRGQGENGRPFLMGLIDIEALREKYDADRSGQKGKRSGSGRPPVGGQSGAGRTAKKNGKINGNKMLEPNQPKTGKNTAILHKSGEGHRTEPTTPLAAG